MRRYQCRECGHVWRQDTRCRLRVQLQIHGHRGFKDDPIYKTRRTLHTGAGLLTDKQIDRINALFAEDAHVEVEATW